MIYGARPRNRAWNAIFLDERRLGLVIGGWWRAGGCEEGVRGGDGERWCKVERGQREVRAKWREVRGKSEGSQSKVERGQREVREDERGEKREEKRGEERGDERGEKREEVRKEKR